MHKRNLLFYNIDEYKNRDTYTEYVVDRSQEFSQLLMENADTSVYGLARLETNDTKYINGLNNTTNQTITNNKVSNIEYEDYGYTEDITKGFAYNGEQQDQTGLIYGRDILSNIEDDLLRNLCSELYRPGASIGRGSTADALRYEVDTLTKFKDKSHFGKATEKSEELEDFIFYNKQYLDCLT